jgi:hypothetical protein
MIDVSHLLARLDESPGGPVTADEVDALMLWVREDHRQVEQIVEACGLDMARLRQLYTVIEQRCRREPSPAAAMMIALRALQPMVAERVTATPEPVSVRPVEPPPAAAPTPEAGPGEDDAAVAEAAPPPTLPERWRAWLTVLLDLPPDFVARVALDRLERIVGRAYCPTLWGLGPTDPAALALIALLIERRRDVNLGRCMVLDDLEALRRLLSPADDRLVRLRLALTRPEVRALLGPEDLPDFGACLALFSDLGDLVDPGEPARADRAGPSDGSGPRTAAEVRAGLGERLERLRLVDAEIRRSAAALVTTVETLDLPRDVAARVWSGGVTLGRARLPVDDLPLDEAALDHLGTVCAMLIAPLGMRAHGEILDAVLRRHRGEAAFMDGLLLLVGRSGRPELRSALRAALGLTEEASDHHDVEAALKRGDAPAAAVALRDLPDHHAAKVLCLCRTAWLLHKAGNAPEAEALAARAMRIAPREALPLQALARLRLEMGQVDAARGLLAAAQRAAPDDPITRRMLMEASARARTLREGATKR